MNPLAALELANELMEHHGLTEKGWRFKFDKATGRLGLCIQDRKLIQLSKPLVEVNDEAQVRDTLLHEIAHAKTPGHGHDAAWRAMCRQIGANPTRAVDAKTINRPPAKLIGACPNCGHEVRAERRPRREKACGDCCRKYNGGRFDPRFVFVYRKNEECARPFTS